jgi:hypothetical protein
MPTARLSIQDQVILSAAMAVGICAAKRPKNALLDLPMVMRNGVVMSWSLPQWLSRMDAALQE